MFFQTRKLKKIIAEIVQRIRKESWEGVEELFSAIPETSSKKMLADKYYWTAIFHREKYRDNVSAKYYFNMIDDSWDTSTYAYSQFALGKIYYDEKLFIEAIKHLENIQKDWDITVYSMARYQLGYYSYLLEDFDKALGFLLEHLMLPDENHCATHLWIARTYRHMNNADKFKEHIEMIPSTDPVYYSIGIIETVLSGYVQSDNEEILLLENVRKEEDNSYRYAQCMLGLLKYNQGLDDEAVEHWLSVTEANNWSYQIAQKRLLSMVYQYLQSENYNDIKKLLDNIKQPNMQYEVDILKSIYEVSDCKKELFILYLKVRSIKNLLQIKQDQNNIYCHKFAHYTSRSVAQMILGSQNISGNLQLNVADLMNDPMEGKILHEILEQPKWLISRFNHRKYQAYASCFSFNHDSLNQFRLYGKEEGKEATGVSMVFDLKMFSEDESSNISTINSQIQQKELNKIEESENKDDVKFPLYQCVYFDPKSGYYKLACRAEMTFYRQGKIDGEELHEVKSKWGAYSNEIFRKENLLRELFEDLKKYLDNISEYVNSDIAENKKNKQKIINLINDILLPIQFLVKHAAFIEEDECRMLYIVGAGSDEIKEMKGKDGKSRLYIEYEPSVVEHLDKIYLSDGAKEERAFLERAWQKALDRDGITDKSIDIRDSDNPFRI